ncbi:MAG: hypothetical protein NZP72_13935, partial [Geminicoccaceae bacterium]|nr:hypothetical protein [Geminicoccaceae bacterium]
MRDLWTGLALVLVVEGLAWAGGARARRRGTERGPRVDGGRRRIAGRAAGGLGGHAEVGGGGGGGGLGGRGGGGAQPIKIGMRADGGR